MNTTDVTDLIKQYLPLYMGAKHRYKYVDSDNWSIWLELTPNRLGRLDDASIENIQLALRRIENVSLEESKEFVSIFYPPDIKVNNENAKRVFYNSCFDFYRMNTVYIPWLLQQRFDLFNLIDKGAAVEIVEFYETPQ